MAKACARAPLGQQIYDQLRKTIVSGELRRGQRLNIAKLAKAFSVSAIPVREALKRLAERGLVCEKPGLGYYVTEVSQQDILDIAEVRMLLEPFALPHLIKGMIEGDTLAQLQKIKKSHELLIDRELGPDELREKHIVIEESLHCDLILSSLHNAYLDRFIGTVMDSILLISQFHCNIMQALEQHLAVIDALLDGDLSGASNALRRHLETSLPLCAKAYEEKRIRTPVGTWRNR